MLQCFEILIKIIAEAKYDILIFVFMCSLKNKLLQSQISWLWENKIEKLFSSFQTNIRLIWFSKQTIVTILGSSNPLKDPSF